MKVNLRSVLACLLVFLLVFPPGSGLAAGFGQIFADKVGSEAKIHPDVVEAFGQGEYVEVLVKLKAQADTQRAAALAVGKLSAGASAEQVKHATGKAVVDVLKNTAERTQAPILRYLSRQSVAKVESYYVVNIIYVKGTESVVRALAKRSDVESILPNSKIEFNPPVKVESSSPAVVAWGVDRVGAPEVWAEYGLDGTGVVVGIIDSGVDLYHEALYRRWRGYNPEDPANSDPTYSWFDAIDGNSMPMDLTGHGTHVAGTILGSVPEWQRQIGIAPGAQWIAARALNEYGQASWLLAAGQFMLAPGGDPSKAPHIINNSWGGGGGPGIQEWYRDMVRNWRAAGILPVFAAGNSGPFAETIEAPGNYPDSFTVGATDINDRLAAFSSRGPGPYAGSVKPNITAPGVNINSAEAGGGYIWKSGTSMAAPHVAGVAALLLQYNPNLTPGLLEMIMEETATPITDISYQEVPNAGYGYGLVNAYNAVRALERGIGTVQGRVLSATGQPLNASVTVRESSRKELTNASGIFSLQHSASPVGQGYTLVIEAFGYHGVEIPITLVGSQILQLGDISLSPKGQGVIRGIVQDKATGNPLADAKIELQYPGGSLTSDTAGRFQYDDVYSGTYRLRIVAEGYQVYVGQVEVRSGETTDLVIELVTWENSYDTILAYEDGIFYGTYVAMYMGDGFGVRMTPPGYAQVMGAQLYVLASHLPQGGTFTVAVFDTDLEGIPGEMVIAPVLVEVTGDGWVYVDLSEYNFITDRDFIVAMIQIQEQYDAPKLGYSRAPTNERGYLYNKWGHLFPYFDQDNFMIRATTADRSGLVEVVQGTVIDSVTGIGVGGSLVSFTCSTTGAVRKALTDDNGQFQIRIPAGSYTVTVVHEYYHLLLVEDVLVNSDSLSVEFQITPLPYLAGRITDSDTGEPLAGANITFMSEDHSYIVYGRTDAQGYYRKPLPPDIYQITVTRDGYYSASGEAEVLDSPLGTILNIQMESYGEVINVSGTVVNDSGLPISWIQVRFERISDQLFFSVVTNSEGHFEIELPAGEYLVFVEISQYWPYREVHSTSQETWDIQLIAQGATGTLSGRVTDFQTGEPLVNAHIYISHETYGWILTVATDSEGIFLAHLPAGDFILEILGQTFTATVVAGENTWMDIVHGEEPDDPAPVAGTLRGRVVDTKTGAPVADVWVVVTCQDTGEYSLALTESDGIYEVTVPEGTYTVRFINSAFYTLELKNIYVFGGQTMLMDVGIQPKPILSGYVTNEFNNAAVGGAKVKIYDTAGTFISETTTNDSGHYRLILPAGQYSMKVSKAGFEDVERDIELVDNDGFGLIENVSMTQLISVNVVVKDYTTDNPLPGMDFILVRASDGRQFSGNTGDTGLVTMELPRGEYRLAVSDSGFWNFEGLFSTDEEYWEVYLLPVSLGLVKAQVTHFVTGLPMGGTTVKFRNSQGTVAELITGIDGRIEVYLPAGNYAVLVEDEEFAVSVVGGETSTLNIVFGRQPEPVQGTVTDSKTGTAVSGVLVSFYSKTTNELVGTILTDAQGKYSYSLGVGEYRVRFTHDSFYAHQQDITVTKDSALVIDTALVALPVISGQVLSSGRGVSGAVLRFYDPQDNLVGETVTDANGNYTIMIPAGTYRVTIYHETLGELETELELEDSEEPGKIVDIKYPSQEPQWPHPDRVIRLSGNNRYVTAVEIAKEGWETSSVVILARGDNFADALAGVPLAYKYGAPILLTRTNILEVETAAEIQRLEATKVIILGGTGAISEKVAGELAAMGLVVERIGGANRFATAALIAKEVCPEGAGTVVLANGMSFADALSVGPYAARYGYPILLTTPNRLPDETKAALTELNAVKTLVIGGSGVVAESLLPQLPAPERIFGVNRYATNVAVAEYFEETSSHIFVATGRDFADALTGAALAARMETGILLVDRFVPNEVSLHMAGREIMYLSVLGGSGVVSDGVVGELRLLLK